MRRNRIMFKTRQHSRNGIAACVLGAVSLTGLVASIIISFINRGAASSRMGGAGLVGMISAILGFMIGIYATKERDSDMLFPRIGAILNAIMIVLWAYIIVVGIYGINY